MSPFHERVNALSYEERQALPVGDVYAEERFIETEVYRYVLFEGRRTGYLRFSHLRSIRTVFKELKQAVDRRECNQCGQQVTAEFYGDYNFETCPVCGGEFEMLVDEYFSIVADGVDHRHDRDFPIRAGQGRVIVWATTGGSEGHYVHIGCIKQRDGDRYVNPPTYHDLYLFKTFRGMEHAQKMAARFTELLGL